MDTIFDWIGETLNYMAPDSRLSWQQDLVTLHAISDIIIAVSYLVIAAGILWALLHRLHITRKQRMLGWLFCIFMLLCGTIQLGEVATLWYPLYGVHGLAKAEARYSRSSPSPPAAPTT